ncbi:MAG: RNA polymerase sigma factor [Bacteroidia bacterium]|nr:sigma-70 family RNA polymerase sigma factor [Bacteroidota bacterium]
MNKQIDEKIIQGCLKKDVKAQQAFYSFFSSSMYAVCLRYSNTKEDAKDILQDGFIKVFAKLNQFSGKGSLEGWMKRVFVNTALEHYRVNKVYMQQSDVMDAKQVSTEAQAIGKLTQQEILSVMQQMAPGFRTILNMYAIEGYTHAEIAEMLGISEGTSKSQLSRARVIFIQTWKKLQDVKK